MKNFIITVAFLFLLSSCDDFFDLKMSNDLTLEQMITESPEQVSGFLIRSYRSFDATPDSWNGNFLDCATDNAVTNELNSGINRATFESGVLRATNNPFEMWTSRYDDIKHINLFLEVGLDESIVYYLSDAKKDSLYKQRLHSEAYFMRAWEEFLLLRHNAGIEEGTGRLMGFPIVTEVMNLENMQDLARNTFDECVEQIVSDIDKALEVGGLRDSWEAQPNGIYDDVIGIQAVGIPTNIACVALKSRVLLYAASPAYTVGLSDSEITARYQKAAEASYAVIEKIGSLPNIYDPYYPDMFFNDAQNDELILRRLDGGKDGQSNGMASRNFPPRTLLAGNGRCNPSQNLVDAFPKADGYPYIPSEANDASMYFNRDPRFYMTILYNGSTFKGQEIQTYDGGNCMIGATGVTELNSTRTGYFLRKWLDPNTNLVGNISKGYHYNALIRKVEMYLNYAEAAYYAYGWEQGNPAGFSAKDAISEVRSRAGVPNDYLNDVSGADALALIKNERRIELCFEGHRFWDLRRWKDNLATPVNGVTITNDFQIHRRTVETPVFNQDYMYYLPLPNNEVLKSNNLTQNAGW